MKWVLALNEDNTEDILTTREAWDDVPFLRLDVDGRPMVIVKEFEAETFEEAVAVKKEFHGW